MAPDEGPHVGHGGAGGAGQQAATVGGGQHGQAAGEPRQQGEGGRGGVPEAGAEAHHGAHSLLLHVTAVLSVGSLQHHLLLRARAGAGLRSAAVLAAVAGSCWLGLAGPAKQF